MGKQEHRRRRGSLSRANCYHNSFCFFLVFLWILSAQFSLSTFSFAFFSFLGHQNLNYAQRVSEASGWRGTVTCLCVTYNIEREREGRGIRQNQEKIEEESVDRRYTAIPCR